jgi:hypothetical protein
MKQISMLTFGCLLLLAFTFPSSHSISVAQNVAGKYGVCVVDKEEAHPISLELTLNTDNTFSYVDNTDPDNKIRLSGKWSMHDGDVILSDYPAVAKIMRIWKPEKDGSALKSRKGTAFYRLCRMGEVVSR